MRITLLVWSCLAALSIGDAAAQIVSRDSIHLKSPGSVVSGSFVLVNKVVPLPPGEFVLIGADLNAAKFIYGDFARQEHKLVDVALGQMVDGKLRAAVGARTVLAFAGGRREWTDEPCKRDDTLFKLNQVPFMKRNYAQNCLMVNHAVKSLDASATGVYAKFASWMREQGGTTPVPTIVNVTITRIEVGEFLRVQYAFDPEAWGCASSPADSWATSSWHKAAFRSDPEKVRFVNSVIEFGKAMQIRVNEAFEGRMQMAESLAATTPEVQRCGLPSPAASPAKSGQSGSASERLRTLEELRDQKLISPAEYEERRKKILDSL